MKSQFYIYFDKFGNIPSRIVILRLFSLLIVLKRKSNLTREILVEVSDNLSLSTKSFQVIERLLQSWMTFPRDINLGTLKHWIRATGINASEDLLVFIFLDAEISKNTNISLKRGFILKETQKIIKSFRNES